MTYRDDLEALRARHAALSSEVADRMRERDEAERVLHEALQRKKLPVLPNIQIAAPCPAEWSSMEGDERSRFCGQCEKNVYNLSDMTRLEAEALILEKEGKLCVRYYQRKDGTVLTKDCPVGVQRRRRRRFFAVSAVALLAGAAVADHLRAAGRCTIDNSVTVVQGGLTPAPTRSAFPPPDAPRPTMGEVAPSVKVPPRTPKVMGKISIPTRELRGDIAGGMAIDPFRDEK